MAERDGLLNRCTGKTVPGVRIPLSPPFLMQQVVKMGGEKLVDDATRRREKYFDAALMMAKDHSMFAYAQTRQAFKIAMQRFDVTAPVY